jgi:ATP-dependent Zn protease
MRWAEHMACRLGFGPAGRLRWQEQPGSEQCLEEIQLLLDQAYRQIREKLARHEHMLHALRTALLDRHELFETELKQLAATHGLQPDSNSGAQASRQEGAT